jgi:histone H3/H4
MISSETPVLFAKACEAFIIELTYRAWAFTLESKRRTLQVKDKVRRKAMSTLAFTTRRYSTS